MNISQVKKLLFTQGFLGIPGDFGVVQLFPGISGIFFLGGGGLPGYFLEVSR